MLRRFASWYWSCIVESPMKTTMLRVPPPKQRASSTNGARSTAMVDRPRLRHTRLVPQYSTGLR